DARSRRRPEFRGSRPPPRRSQTPARHRTGRGRRSHRQTARGAGQGRRLCRDEKIRRVGELAEGLVKTRRQQHAKGGWLLFTLPWRGSRRAKLALGVARWKRAGWGE